MAKPQKPGTNTGPNLMVAKDPIIAQFQTINRYLQQVNPILNGCLSKKHQIAKNNLGKILSF